MKKHLLVSFFLFLFISPSYCCTGDSIPYIKARGILSSTLVRSGKAYNLYDLVINGVDPTSGDTLQIRVHFFENKKTGKLPLLIIVPPINGVSMRERKVSDHFISEGYHTVVIEPVKNISDNTVAIKDFQKRLLCFISAVRSTVDVFEVKEQVDPENMFVWAASMGAIYSSYAVCADKRINAAVLVVGGAPLSGIVTDSKQKYVVRYRKERMKVESLASTEAFRQKMKESMSIDVLQLAKNRAASDLYFILALKDKSVPTAYQLMLADTFGPGSTIKKYKSGHAKTLFRSHLFHLNDYSDFLNSKLRH
ncbi:MAG: hypothetical protein JWO44_2584 [Bacteroidetes bacterium]|nr:hypothetical protein [Bacteroidota bacterium]